ncbi:uncharacterized protein KY384_002965 [Bacidia gigantensis]|uniref:uncharacterized protein n=1 Tax=Bacidia gigantensis TaxID=2732470 RepID=UPI001D04A8E1|nr:uncharacterized protein KY384_002965 [Bacidia gigantensis]KAG8531336.1 hypothetical protein KY384_002965 [Bacidia gigantensis]
MTSSPEPPQFNLYTTTIPLYLRAMTNLLHQLQKASSHSLSSGTPPSYYLNARLYPDMQGLPYQIQRLTDTAKFTLVRVLGHDPTLLKMEDNESTFPELTARVEKTMALLQGVKEEEMAEVGRAGTKEVVLTRADGFRWETGPYEYVTKFAMPNFWFHVSMAYAILRMCGVPVGKNDFIGTEA